MTRQACRWMESLCMVRSSHKTRVVNSARPPPGCPSRPDETRHNHVALFIPGQPRHMLQSMAIPLDAHLCIHRNVSCIVQQVGSSSSHINRTVYIYLSLCWACLTRRRHADDKPSCTSASANFRAGVRASNSASSLVVSSAGRQTKPSTHSSTVRCLVSGMQNHVHTAPTRPSPPKMNPTLPPRSASSGLTRYLRVRPCTYKARDQARAEASHSTSGSRDDNVGDASADLVDAYPNTDRLGAQFG